MIGKFAISAAGHDEGILYVVIGEENNKLFLSDGAIRPVENPKIKNCKHVEILDEGIEAVRLKALKDKSRSCNELIKQELRLFWKRHQG